MTKGVFELQEILRLQMKIVPELVDLLEKRYNVLRTIYYKQPIGRRVLANNLNLGERIVRAEINFLKEEGLIEVRSPGMTITKSGEEIVFKLKDFIHGIKGLSDVEKRVKELLGLRDVIIVPGDVDENKTILKDIGKAGANYLKDNLKSNSKIALTGGSTIKELIESFPQINTLSEILVVPARGGMGRQVETQANSLAASLAKKINGSYEMLHIPGNLSPDVLEKLLKEKEIKEVINCIRNSDILIYGIGNAIEMAEKRSASTEKIKKLKELGAVGEAFGFYFDKDSKVVSQSVAIGIDINEVSKIKVNIAVAGGKNKIEAVISTMRNNSNGVLVTDEAIGRGILKALDDTQQ